MSEPLEYFKRKINVFFGFTGIELHQPFFLSLCTGVFHIQRLLPV